MTKFLVGFLVGVWGSWIYEVIFLDDPKLYGHDDHRGV